VGGVEWKFRCLPSPAWVAYRRRDPIARYLVATTREGVWLGDVAGATIGGPFETEDGALACAKNAFGRERRGRGPWAA
jgi:hypothetical protein